MKKTILLYTFLLGQIAYSQSILMTVDKDTIYTSTFEKYQKNSLEQLGVKQTIGNYTDFSLLKQYALKYGVQNSPAFQAQLVREGEQLKDSIYYSPEVIEPVLQDYYQKLMKERKLQLLIFKEEVLPKERKEREKFIQLLIKQINSKSLTFKEAVEKYSITLQYENPIYFDIFSLEKQLVDEIYKAPLNQITEFNVMDAFYSLILVSAERKYLGEVALDEILIQDSPEKAEAIYKQIKQGEDFVEAKKEYSQITGNSAKSFYADIQDDILYNYISNSINNKTNTISPPIETKEGYKIYKYLFRENYDTYSNAKDKIYARLKESKEVNSLDDKLVAELKKASFYKVDSQEIKKIINSLPKKYQDFQRLDFPKEKELVVVGDQIKLTNQELLNQVKKISEAEYPNIGVITQYILYDWEKKALLEYYKTHFNQLERNKEVWGNLENKLLIKYAFKVINKQALEDVKGQKEFLEREASRFTWDERVKGTFYFCLNTEIEKEVVQMLKNKKSADYIANYYKGKTDSNKNELVVVNKGKYTRESINLPLDQNLSKKVYVVDYKSRKLVIDIEEILKNDKMSLEELQTTYISEYIDYKTEEIMKQLKKEAIININKAQEEILEKKYGL